MKSPSHKYFLPTPPSLLADPGRPFIHRDLSWNQFNDRILHEARSHANPIFERMKFLSITSSNLDEFFMIRFASLDRSVRGQLNAVLVRTRTSILDSISSFTAKQAETLDMLIAELAKQGIRLPRPPYDESVDLEGAQRVFDEKVLPVLGTPEPFAPSALSSFESLGLTAILHNHTWLKIPRTLPHAFLDICGRTPTIVFLDDLLTVFLSQTFRAEGGVGFVRVTRDRDFILDFEYDDPTTIPDKVRSGLGMREKRRLMRIQYSGDLDPGLLSTWMSIGRLTQGQIIAAPSTLCLTGLWTVMKQMPHELKAKPELALPMLKAPMPRPLRDKTAIFSKLRERDFLLHHPYDSFDSYVNWIEAACEDPNTVMIQQTIYRMDALSPVIDALKSAASSKSIRVFIELRARFDEMNNLKLADELRKAGVQVAFGFGRLKLHAKVALVTRQEAEGLKHYTHLSTGNYNAATAREYEDLAILTSNAQMGLDAAHFFDSVWAGKIPSHFKLLVPAPIRLHRKLLGLIEAETENARQGKHARIIAKVNALVDETVIEHLYEASRAGVKIDLIVRGSCSLIPGVKNLSENIRVISLVDRFLEHSRIYYFESSHQLYLSSADWMPRNFFSRLELAFPIVDPDLYSFIESVLLPAYLADTVKARELTPQGTWKRRKLSAQPFGKHIGRSQYFFEALAACEYEQTPLQ